MRLPFRRSNTPPPLPILPSLPTRSPRTPWRARPLALLALALAAACGDDGPSAPEPNPAPAVTAVSPTTVQAGSAEATITVTGSRFIAQSTVRFNGADRTTEFVSATELRARLTAADLATAGTAQVSVASPAPGGGASNAAELLVANPAPAVASLSPGAVAAGSPGATVTLVGTGFVPTSEVRAGGAPRTTTYVSATELRVALTAADVAAAGPAQLTVFNPAPGGGVSNAAALAVDNPVPAIAALSPTFVPTGSPGATVALVGTGFVPQSQVLTGAAARQAAYVSPTELRVTLTAAEVAAAGTLDFHVQNPAPGGGSSNTKTLELRAPVPVITSLATPQATVGEPSFALRVNGTGFAANAEVRFGGAARPTRLLSPTQLEATLNVGDLQAAGSVDVTVVNPAPGGGTSNALAFVVANPGPVIAPLSPCFVPTGSSGSAVTVSGTGFVPQSQVLTGASPRQTTFVSATELTVALTAAEVAAAGTLDFHVQNPAPGGGTSNTRTLELRAPVPVIASLDPAHALDGQGTLELKVIGTGFAANSEVRIGGSARPTRATGTTLLTATLNVGDLAAAGTFSITVATPGPGGGTSNAATFEVRAPAPVITSLAPTQALAGQPTFALGVNGTGFRAGSQVRVNGSARPTQVVSPTRLEATLSAGDLQAAGSLDITVTTPAPGGGTSAAAQFQVANPAPQISFLPSRGASAGRQGFTLAVHGRGFARGSVVRWNGSDRPTTFISDTRVTASITSGDVASPGTAQVTVHTPAPGGGTSAAVAMQVRAVPAPALTANRQVAIPARDLVWSAATGRLYASVPSSVPTYGNSVVAIDPATGDVTGSVFVGSEPGAMAVSGNGDVLYVSLIGSSSIRRVSLATLTAGLEFSLSAVAEEIAVMPGRPGTVAVSLQNTRFSPRHEGVCVYDDGVRRDQCTQGHTGSNSIEFGEDGSVLYGYNNETTEFGFRSIAVTADGLQQTRVKDGLVSGFGVRIHFASGRVYASDGSVVDAARLVRVGSIGGGWPAPDPTLGRVFVLGFDGTVTAFDMNHLTALGSVSPGASGTGLIRWGSDGLAFREADGIRILRTPLAAP